VSKEIKQNKNRYDTSFKIRRYMRSKRVLGEGEGKGGTMERI